MAYRIVLSDNELDAIKAKKRKTVHYKIRRKLEALLQLNAGVKNITVAERMGISLYTLTRWAKQYKEEGLEGYARLNYHPKPSVLDEHRQWLDTQIEDHNIQTIRQLNHKLETERQVKVHYLSLYRYCKKNSATLTKRQD